MSTLDFLRTLTVEHELYSARWREGGVSSMENLCSATILESKSFKRSSSLPRFVLVITPVRAKLNHERLSKAVLDLYMPGEESDNISSFAWELATDENIRTFLGNQAGIDATALTTLTSVNVCPLWAAPDPSRAPRIPTFLCQSAAKPFLWMHTGTVDTALGLSLRDVMKAIQPSIVKRLSKHMEDQKVTKLGLPALQRKERVVKSTAASPLSLKEQKNQGIASKNIPLSKFNVKGIAPISISDNDPVPARETTEGSSTVNDTGGPESSHDDDYTSEDDGNMFDGLLSDDDDLAMLNQLTRENPDFEDDNDQETIDFEETATTGELGLEEELLEDSRHATVTERVSDYRVERIRHFERRTPSRTISVEEHPESDPEDIAEAEAPPAESRSRPAPRRRRRRRKLRRGDEGFERRTPNRSVSVSEHPDFDPECLEEANITETKASASAAPARRRAPLRHVSSSEHPSFDMEANITEAKAPTRRRAPSRAISSSEHPSFDREETITEAVPPRLTSASRNFARGAGLREVARQVEIDLAQDRKEQALAEATFASESSLGAEVLDEAMPTAEEMGEDPESDEGTEEEETDEEEETTLHVDDEPTETQNGTEATETSTLE